MAVTKKLNLLLLEDNPDDAVIVLRELKKAGFHVESQIVNSEPEFLKALRTCPDLIISDHYLPQFNAIRALEYVRERSDEIPFIIVSGAIPEEMAVEAMRQGASDYLLKDRLARLGQSVRQALIQRQDRREKREAVEAIHRSEERYRLLAEHSTDMISRHAPDGQYTYVSPACRHLLGFDPEELTGRYPYEQIHVDNVDDVRESHRALLEDSDIQVVTYRCQRKEGTYVWIESTCKSIFNEAGDIEEFISASRDITARKETELALVRSEERWRRLVEIDPTPLMVTSNGRIEYVNRAATHLLEADERNQLLGRPASLFFRPENGGTHFDAWLEEAVDDDSSPPLQFRLIRPSGEERVVEVVSIGTTYRARHAVLSVIRDVSEQRRYELALIKAKERAEEMSDLKSAFLMNMSHEIRTPLTGIIGLAEILAEVTTDESSEFASLICESGHRLLDTLNSVLELAALEGHGIEIHLRPTNLNELVSSSVKLFQHTAEKRGLDLTVENAAGETVTARTDEAALARVLSNIISNAIKFTEKGGVVVRFGVADSEAFVEIEDTGVGISPVFLPNLFDEFKQESTGVRRSHEGTGLGLTISKRLVDLLEGRITVESRKGKGSRFTVYLPLEDESGETAAARSNVSPSIPADLRVLVVDDQEDTLLLLKKLLADQCRLTIVRTFEEAQEAFRADTFDAALIDINLRQEHGGMELAKWCRKKLKKPPYLVAFTAYALPSDKSRFLQEGFDDYLSKPFVRRELMDVLSRISDQR